MHACIIHYIVDRIYFYISKLTSKPGSKLKRLYSTAQHTGMPYLGSLSASFPWAVRNAKAQRYSERNSAGDRMHTSGEELGMHCHAMNEMKLDEGESISIATGTVTYYILHMHVCIQKCVAAQTPCDDEMTMRA
jgi:hypothetical protein